jgi:hypothetical protein
VGSLASTGSVLPGQEEILELRLFGDAGHLVWDVNAGRASLHGRDGSVEALPPLAPEDRYPEAAPARNLVEVALGRAPNGSPGELGARVVAFLEAMYRAAGSGRTETVATPRPMEVIG